MLATKPVYSKLLASKDRCTCPYLEIYLQKAEELHPSSTNSSDPFVVFTLGSDSVKSSTKSKTTNPEYYETLCLAVDLSLLENHSIPLTVEVFDSKFLSSDERKGRGLVHLDVPLLIRQSQQLCATLEKVEEAKREGLFVSGSESDSAAEPIRRLTRKQISLGTVHIVASLHNVDTKTFHEAARKARRLGIQQRKIRITQEVAHLVCQDMLSFYNTDFIIFDKLSDDQQVESLRFAITKKLTTEKAFYEFLEARSKELYEKASVDASIQRVLLMGASNAGKSTLLKQCKLIVEGGISQNFLANTQELIYANILRTFVRISQVASEYFIEFKTIENNQYSQELMELGYLSSRRALELYTDMLHEKNISFWNDPTLQQMLTEPAYCIIADNLHYFFDPKNHERIRPSEYVHSSKAEMEQDYIAVSVSTCGTTNASNMEFNDRNLFIHDFGGAQLERKKYARVIDMIGDVSAMVFCLSLVCYDRQVSVTDDMNQLEDAMQLFGELLLAYHAKPWKWVVLLTFEDLLEQKLIHSPFGKYVANYTGTNTATSVIEYLTETLTKTYEKFKTDTVLQVRSIHLLDTEQAKSVLDAVL